MFFYRRFTPGLAIYSYIVGDPEVGRCVVIDPTRDVDDYIDIAEKEGLVITDIMETHVHADYLCGSKELKHRLGGKPAIHCSGMGGDAWTAKYADNVVKDGDQIQVGSLRFEAVYSPGHTPEHVMWALYDEQRSKETPWMLFTGDLLFVGAIGRPDLLGAEAQKALSHQLYDTVFNRMPVFPDFTEVYPAHGQGSLCGKAIGSRDSTTVGYERQFNTSLIKEEEGVWTKKLLDDMPEAPPYFLRMKKMNVQGAPLLGKEFPGNRGINAKELKQMMDDGAQVLDTRSKESFAATHIPGSINIPLAATLSLWAGWVLDYHKPIVLVLDKKEELKEVVTHLVRIGLDQCIGYLDGGITAWEDSDQETDRVETLTPKQLHGKLSEYVVLDVRSPGEWSQGHIAGAIHIPLGVIEENIDQIPKNKPIAIMCGSGYRASVAASFLKRNGIDTVTNILGGMRGWVADNLPTTSGD
ncbi:MAG: MBL fold metallo-hydrolase [Chlamydiia bacterium]|nr:MBL fold metallo-hydrolase [Chlamydiia bacterium]